MIIYLYVKQHSVTGLKYFGKTTQKNPFKYLGSGSYWKNHIKKYGKSIKTLEIWGFDDQELCTEFALKFSNQNQIVESNEWANQIPEDGMNATPNVSGLKLKTEVKESISKSISKLYWWNDGTNQIRSASYPGDPFIRGRLKFSRKSPSKETLKKLSESHKNQIPWNKGKSTPLATRLKLSEASKGVRS